MALSIQSVSYFDVTLSKVVFRKKIRLASLYFDYAALKEGDDGIAEPMDGPYRGTLLLSFGEGRG
jgi:hypothetical protein